MKFLLDMGISPRAAATLREWGHEAIHLHEEGLEKLTDSEILAKARLEKSIVLTHDLDFADLLAASGEALPSVVLFRLRDMRPQSVSHHLGLILARSAEALRGEAILVVSEGQIRQRALPIGRSGKS